MITKGNALELIGTDTEFYIVDKGIEISNFKHWTSIRVTKTTPTGSPELINWFIRQESGNRHVNIDIIHLEHESAIEDFRKQVVK